MSRFVCWKSLSMDYAPMFRRACTHLLNFSECRVSGGTFEGAVITCTVSASIDSTPAACQFVLDGKVSTVCFSKTSITIFRTEIVRKIVVCFERLNFEKSVRAVDEKQDISLLWP